MITDSVINRLKSFGYVYDEQTDGWLLNMLIDKNKNYIRNQINNNDIPTELFEILIDKITADMLESKWASGQLDIESINLSDGVKKIQEGDTTVEMVTGKDDSYNPERRFLNGLEMLRKLDFSYARFRRFTW